MKEILFPVPVLTAGMLLGKPGIALLVDLPAGLDRGPSPHPARPVRAFFRLDRYRIDS